jgi:membrane-bound metal-dependent hydrolase YbcI (DUF457 family)
MDVLASLVVVALLVGLLIWTRRRWGQPRLYMRGVAALWLVVGLLVLIMVALALR